MSFYSPTDKGTTIRQPATANLMIDSADRDEARYNSPWDFQITKGQSILNGFFTRVGTTEVTLEWNIPNGLVFQSLPAISVTWQTGPSTQNVFPVVTYDQFYTVEQALDLL